MLSSAAYLNAVFPDTAPPVTVTSAQLTALKALSEAAYTASRVLGRGHPFEVNARLMARVSDGLVDRAALIASDQAHD